MSTSTITVRDQEYELVENEYASMNAILLFLSLLDPKTSEKFARMDVTLDDLREEIKVKYDELSDFGKKSIHDMSSRVMFMLNTDPELFPNVLNYRAKAYQYIKALIPSAPVLDENFAGTTIADFLLAVTIPEAIRNANPSAPKAKVAKSSKKKGFNVNAPQNDELAGALIDELHSTKNADQDTEFKVVSIDAIAVMDPTIIESTDAYYADLLEEQRKNTVILIDKAEIAPIDIEEELEG